MSTLSALKSQWWNCVARQKNQRGTDFVKARTLSTQVLETPRTSP